MVNCGVAGGFGSYLLGLNKKTYLQAGVDVPGNKPESTKEPEIGWMTGFLFATGFVGLLALVPLRKVFSFFCIIYFLKFSLSGSGYRLTCRKLNVSVS